MTRRTATAHITFTYDPDQGADLRVMEGEIADQFCVWTDIEIQTIDIEEAKP